MAGSQLQTLACNERATKKEEMEAVDTLHPGLAKLDQRDIRTTGNLVCISPGSSGRADSSSEDDSRVDQRRSPFSVKPRVSFKQTGTKPGN